MREERTPKQTRQLCHDFITHYYYHQSVNAYDAAAEMRSKWGLTLDWHEFSNALDAMYTKHQARVTGIDEAGMTVYVIEALQ